MPMRMVDGDRIWTSSTLRKLPEKYRLHYANWLPMAEANGTFEADPEKIHHTIYNFLVKSVTVREVKHILSLFIEHKLVIIWKENGKTWGFFSGMEKKGRLPSKSQLVKYKELPPSIPEELLDQSKTGLAWIGLDRNGKEGIGAASSLTDESISEEEMRISEGATGKRLREELAEIWQDVKNSRTVLLEPHQSFLTDWKSIAKQCSKSSAGEKALVDAFRLWAQELGSVETRHPFNDFIKHANDYLARVQKGEDKPAITTTPEEQERIDEAVRRQREELARALDRSDDVEPETKLAPGELF